MKGFENDKKLNITKKVLQDLKVESKSNLIAFISILLGKLLNFWNILRFEYFHQVFCLLT